MNTPSFSILDVEKAFKMIMLDKKMKQIEAAAILGMDKRVFNRTIKRNSNLRIKDIAKIVSAFDCDIRLSFTDRKSGKEWLCDFAGDV